MKTQAWKRVAIGLAILCGLQLLLLMQVWRIRPAEALTVFRDSRSEELAGHLKEYMAVGTLVPFIGSPDALPDDWLPCAGQALSSSDYRELSAIVGESYSRGPVIGDQLTLLVAEPQQPSEQPQVNLEFLFGHG